CALNSRSKHFAVTPFFFAVCLTPAHVACANEFAAANPKKAIAFTLPWFAAGCAPAPTVAVTATAATAATAARNRIDFTSSSLGIGLRRKLDQAGREGSQDLRAVETDEHVVLEPDPAGPVLVTAR